MIEDELSALEEDGEKAGEALGGRSNIDNDQISDLVAKMPDLEGDELTAMNSAIGAAAAFKTASEWTPRDQMEFVWKMARRYYRQTDRLD